MTRPPCIVCGRRRGHDAAEHDRYRVEYRRCKHLLRKTWPRLAGLRRLLDFYERQAPPRPAPPQERQPIDWHAKVLPDGSVVHVPVYEDEQESA